MDTLRYARLHRSSPSLTNPAKNINESAIVLDKVLDASNHARNGDEHRLGNMKPGDRVSTSSYAVHKDDHWSNELQRALASACAHQAAPLSGSDMDVCAKTMAAENKN